MFNEAMVDLNKALELNSKSAELYFTRAEVYAALGKMDEAQADLKSLMNLISCQLAWKKLRRNKIGLEENGPA